MNVRFVVGLARIVVALIVVGMAVVIAVSFATSGSRNTKVAAVTPDPVFGEYRHVYAVRMQRYRYVPFQSMLTNGGPLTDLDHKPLQSFPLPEFPQGCISVVVDFDRNVNKGVTIPMPGGDGTISSMSETVQIIACKATVPEFDAITGPPHED